MRTLVVGVDWLGDALFMTPIFKALKRRWPDGHVAVSTASRNVPVLSRCEFVDAIIPYDEVPFLLGLGDQARLAARYKEGRFDIALLLHRSFTRALAAARAGIPRRIGFSHPKRDWLLTEALPIPSESWHRIDAYLSVLKPLELSIEDRRPEVHPNLGDAAEWSAVRSARTSWEPDDRFLTLHVGGNWHLKRWPIQHFVALARRASSAGWRVAVCGTESESALGKAVEFAIPGDDVKSFCGATSFGGLVGMLAASKLVISNDSGPLHLAAALGTPVLGLFGPTLDALTGPVGSGPVRILRKDFGCELPCFFEQCANRVCLDRLMPDEVSAAAAELLKESVKW